MAAHGIHPSALTSGHYLVEDLFAQLPKGHNLYRRAVKDVTKSVDKALDNATRQIRATKTLFDIPAADGLVIVLNEHIHLLGHVFFEERLRLTLGKKTSNGTPYHSDITYVLAVIEAASVTRAGESWAVNTYYDNPPVPDRHGVKEFIHRLAEAWASYSGHAFATADGDDQLYELMRNSKLAVRIE